MNLEHIKLELESLNEKVKQLEVNQGDSITLTKKQLKQLIDKAIENAWEEATDEIKNNLPSIEDYVTLDLYDREIQLDFDDRTFCTDLTNNLDMNSSDIEPELIEDMLKTIQESKQ